jgi:DNA-binding response OmpR family regulator
MARVLLVEDEPSIAGITAFELGREGHEVRCEAAAGDAPRALAGFGPDLAAVDAGLEGGVDDLLTGPGPRCPVLVPTDARDAGAPERALRAGSAAAIPRPFKPTVLARTAGELIRTET